MRSLAQLAAVVCLSAVAAAQVSKPGFKPPLPATGGGTGSQSLLAGGADACTTPDPVVGPGPHAFNTTGATTGTQGQSEAACDFFGTTVIARDVWFTWTASLNGSAELSLCGGAAGVDTKIAVYAGNTCPAGPALACNDDACALISSLQFPVAAGQSYVFQIGHFLGTGGGSGTFTITESTVPLNDSCATPGVIAGAGPHAFNNQFATTGAQGQSEALCLFTFTTGIANDLWFAWTSPVGGAATLTVCGGLGMGSGTDTKVAIYRGSGCPAGAAIACNDDSGGACGLPSTVSWSAQCGETYTIQLGRFPGSTASFGSFTVNVTGTNCATGAPYCFGDGSGTACPCTNSGAPGNGCASSVNAAGANLRATGSPSLSGDTIALLASGMPSSTCLFFQGTTSIGAQFGDGLRCAGGTIIRLGTRQITGGAAQYPVAGDPPVSVRGQVAAPGNRTYQVWYRNAATFCTPDPFNLTNGVSIGWLP